MQTQPSNRRGKVCSLTENGRETAFREPAGATLCSACSGLLLLAETDLLAGHKATMHWAYEQTFRRNFPDVHLRLEEMIVVAAHARG